MKLDFTNLTFTIPVRIDSPDRQENIAFIIDYLLHNFDTNIIIYENGPEPLFENKYNVQHFYEKSDGLFHRTKYLNRMARMANTDFIANYDCDVIFPVSQLEKSYNLLVEDRVDLIYPYDGLFVNIQRNVLKALIAYDPAVLIPTEHQNFGTQSMGGAILWNKKAFIAGGMENEHFISWGCEDWERIRRFTKLGYRPGRIKGPLYHIDHSRTHNSNETNPHYQKNVELFQRIDAMTGDEIREHIKSWPWLF